MLEFLEMSLLGVNLPYTFLMILVLLYWGTVFLGLIDMDTLDFDLDHEVDVDIDADVDADVDHGADVHGGSSTLASFLHFFNIGDMPIMIIISFWALFMWVGSVLMNYYILNTSLLWGAILFFPLAFTCLFLTKFATWPFLKIFKAMAAEEDTNVIGKECTVILEADSTSRGQAEVVTSGYHQRITILASEGNVLVKGSKGLVVDFDQEKQSYLVTLL